jgi:hypothetical protein
VRPRDVPDPAVTPVVRNRMSIARAVFVRSNRAPAIINRTPNEAGRVYPARQVGRLTIRFGGQD